MSKEINFEELAQMSPEDAAKEYDKLSFGPPAWGEKVMIEERKHSEWISEAFKAGIEYQKAKDTWISVEDAMPEHNIGVLVFIPDEDDHIASGMWDIENKWVLLDEYRVPECEVTHWHRLPVKPTP